MRMEWTRAEAEGMGRRRQAGELKTHGLFTTVPGDHGLDGVNQSLFSLSLFSLSHVCVFYLSSSASLLACGIHQAFGQMFISPDSLIGVKGFRTVLVLDNTTQDAQEYSWHRGAEDTVENMIVSYKPPFNSWLSGPMFSGRENVTRLGDLVIRRSAFSDTGNYTVRVDTGNETQRATGWLEIQGELAGCPISIGPGGFGSEVP